MRVYLAHNFAARDWLKSEVIPFLESKGHKVVSNWITDDRHLENSWKVESAVQDLQDIESCGALIFFADQFGIVPGEGKYVELGCAVRAGKIIIVVGIGRCVFYNLCSVRRVTRYVDVIPYLGGDCGKLQEGSLQERFTPPEST
jgi:hypothetical protein